MRKIFNIIISVAPIIYILILFNDLPNIVPIHYNALGVVDGYGSKYFYLLFSFIPLVLNIVQKLMVKSISKENIKAYSNVITIIILFFSIISIILSYSALQNEFSMFNILLLMFGLLFMYIGFNLKNVEPNKYFGIRLPATLKSKKVWYRVHYIGSYLFFSMGLVMTLMVILDINYVIILITMIISLLTIVIGLWIYSNKI